MSGKKILFISGSIGLGHITRDLEIAKEIRRQIPDVELEWLASGPARMVLEGAGEELIPAASQWTDYMKIAEEMLGEIAVQDNPYSGNIVTYSLCIQKHKDRNVDILRQFLRYHDYDLIIGDETMEVALAIRTGQMPVKPPFVMMYDFIGMESMTRSLKEKLIVYLVNRKWARGYDRIPRSEISCLFIGELEDVPDKRFGFLLSNRRDQVRRRYDVLGYVVRFDPADYEDQKTVRAELGYGSENLVVCSVGGTGLGKPVLELCGRAYSLLKDRIPDLHMVLVGGPDISPQDLSVPPGVDVRGYVPDLYEHFAASDLAIVMGGGTTTIELTALGKPFLYFPFESHFEQAVYIADRLDRHRAGVRMWFSETTAKSLADAIIGNLGIEVDYEPIRIDGARRAAMLVAGLLEGREVLAGV